MPTEKVFSWGAKCFTGGQIAMLAHKVLCWKQGEATMQILSLRQNMYGGVAGRST